MWHVSRFVFFLAALFCLSASAAEPQGHASKAAKQQTPAGDIVTVSGTVFIRSDKKSRQGESMRPAKAGDTVYSQDVVNTSSDGHIKILMRDKSIVDLGPSALFKLDKFEKSHSGGDRQVEVSMVYGTMRAAITQKLQGKSQFKVRTPSATMGVRGTEFVVKSEIHDLKDIGQMLNHSSASLAPPNLSTSEKGAPQAATQITVLQGQVDVSKKEFNAHADSGRLPASAGVVSLTAGNQISTQHSEAGLSTPQTMDSNQLKSVSTDSKVVDTTFQKATVIEPTTQSSSSSNSGSGSGNSTTSHSSEAVQQVVAATVSNLPPPPTIKPADINIPGALGANQAFTQPQINIQGVQKHLRVVILTN